MPQKTVRFCLRHWNRLPRSWFVFFLEEGAARFNDRLYDDL